MQIVCKYQGDQKENLCVSFDGLKDTKYDIHAAHSLYVKEGVTNS